MTEKEKPPITTPPEMTPLYRGWGIVFMKDGTWAPNGVYKRAFVGWLEFFDHSQLGIVKPGDTSWAVRVKSEEGAMREMIVPGCQVRCVMRTESRETSNAVEYWQI